MSTIKTIYNDSYLLKCVTFVHNENIEKIYLYIQEEYKLDNDIILQWSAEYGYFEMFRYIHNLGADITLDNNIALYLAIDSGNIDIIKYICENGINIHSQNNKALRRAVKRGNSDIVIYLCENGADMSIFDGEFLDNWCTRIECTEIIKYLIERNIDISSISKIFADLTAGFGILEDVIYFVTNKKYIDIDIDSMLSCAIRYENYSSMQYLYENGAKISSVDGDSSFITVVRRGNFNIIKYLYENDLYIDIDKPEILNAAIENNHIKIVKYLCENGANIQSINKKLMIRSLIVSQLDLSMFIYENVEDSYLYIDSALMRASRFNLDTVKYFHNLGGDINSHHCSSLCNAVISGQADIVKYLCENNADITIMDISMLRMAASRNHTQFYNTLDECVEIFNNIKMMLFLNAIVSRSLDTVKYIYNNIIDMHVIDNVIIDLLIKINDYYIKYENDYSGIGKFLCCRRF